jgi:hypothetical protein
MSRRRNKQTAPENKTILAVRIDMKTNGRVEVDPKYQPEAVVKLDDLYEKAHREDYDASWTDDHKVAYFLFQIFDEILQQYEPIPEEIDATPGVPHIRDAPVREVFDISSMSKASTNMNRQ